MQAFPVSVVIPTYNRSDLLVYALESIWKQTIPVQEIVVVDDGSTDDTEQVARAYGDLIRYFRQENRGQASARNLGVERANHEWIAFLDSDDLWLPRKLELQIAAMQAMPEADVCYTAFAFVENGDSPLTRVVYIPPGSRREMFIHSLDGCLTLPSTMLFRRKCFLDAGGFDPALRLGEDWDLLARLSVNCDFTAVPDVMTLVRKHAGNTTKQVLVRVNGDLQAIEKIFDMKEADEFRDRKSRLIAGATCGAGEQLYYQNETRAAREMFLRSLVAYPFWPHTWTYLFKTAIPRQWLARWRHARHGASLAKQKA